MAMRMWIYGTVVFLCYLTVQGEEECDPGKYGDACSQNCSKNCAPLPSNIVLCHKETGECYEGCKSGVYGDQCDEPCSKHCLGNTCNQHNGHCTRGCIENHIGVFCEIYNGITIVHQGTTYSSNTTVTTGEAPTSSSQVIIPAVVTVLVLILILMFVGPVVIFIWVRRKRKKMKSALYLEDGQGFFSAPLSETQRERGRREKLLGSNQGDSATPTHARRDAWADADLHVACRKGNLSEVKRIMDRGRADVNCTGVSGITPVMWAAWGGHRDVVELLVSRGADVSLVDNDGNNTLHFACKGGDRKTVEFVLSLDRVDINARNNTRQTAVDVARRWGHRNVLKLLETSLCHVM